MKNYCSENSRYETKNQHLQELDRDSSTSRDILIEIEIGTEQRV